MIIDFWPLFVIIWLQFSHLAHGKGKKRSIALWFGGLDSAMPKLAEQVESAFKQSGLRELGSLSMKCFSRLDKTMVEGTDRPSRNFDLVVAVGPPSLSADDFDNFITKNNDNVMMAVVGETARHGNAFEAAKIIGRVFLLCGDVTTMAQQTVRAVNLFLHDQKLSVRERNLKCDSKDLATKNTSRKKEVDFKVDYQNCDRQRLKTRLLPRRKSFKKSSGPNVQEFKPEVHSSPGNPVKNLEKPKFRYGDQFGGKKDDDLRKGGEDGDSRQKYGIPSKDLEFYDLRKHMKSDNGAEQLPKSRAKKKSWMDFAPLAQDTVAMENEKEREKKKKKHRKKLSGYVKTFHAMVTKHEMKKRILDAFSQDERQNLFTAYHKIFDIKKQEEAAKLLQGGGSNSTDANDTDTNPSLFSNTTQALAMILSQLVEHESVDDLIKDQTSILAMFSPDELKVLHKLAQKALGENGKVDQEMFLQLRMLNAALASIEPTGKLDLFKKPPTKPPTPKPTPPPPPPPPMPFPRAEAMKKKPKKHSSSNKGAVIGAVGAMIVVGVAVFAIIAVFIRKQNKEDDDQKAVFRSLDDFFSDQHGEQNPDPETFLPGGTGSSGGPPNGRKKEFFADMDQNGSPRDPLDPEGRESPSRKRRSRRSELRSKVSRGISKVKQAAKDMHSSMFPPPGSERSEKSEHGSGYISWDGVQDFLGQGILKKSKKSKEQLNVVQPRPANKSSRGSKRPVKRAKTSKPAPRDDVVSAPRSEAEEKSQIDTSQKSQSSKSSKVNKVN